MKNAILCLLLTLAMGCASPAGFTGTTVDLSKKNFRVVKQNVIGKSHGFRLLGILPFANPRLTKAISNLYDTAGIKEGGSIAMVNVEKERSVLYLILFSVPTK